MGRIYQYLVRRAYLRPIFAIVLTIILTLLLFLPLAFNAIQAYSGFNHLITRDFRLQQLTGTIRHLDEVLTMSAQMNAATGKSRWEERYERSVPQLDAALTEVRELAPDIYEAQGTAETDAANLKLIEMETQSFELVQQGELEAAQLILNGIQYAAQKRLYNEGVEQSNQAIQQQIGANQTRFRRILLLSSIVSGGSLLILLPVWGGVLKMLNRYLSDLVIERHKSRSLNQQLEHRVLQRTADLTQALDELKQTQMQLVQSEKMSALGEVVAGVAHEINNPIGFIKGNLRPAVDYVTDLFGLLDLYQRAYPEPTPTIVDEIETMELDFVRDDLPALLNSMNLGIERICNISDSLRTFSRADQHHRSIVDLHEGIDSTLLILKHRLKANDIRPAIEVVQKYGHISPVNCFAGQLNQVFMNILANAIDAFDELDPHKDTRQKQSNQITVTTHAIESDVVISIRDNAGGMPPEIQSNIFEHLYTTKPVGKGTGLGLAIAQQIIVEKHQGSITVDSSLGEGTTFHITLPIHLS